MICDVELLVTLRQLQLNEGCYFSNFQFLLFSC